MTKTAPSTAIWILDSPETRDISRDLCLRAAQAQALTVDHQLIDQRPRFGRSRAFNALLQLLNDRAISTVLVASFSELARSVPDLRDLTDALAAADCRLIVVSENIDTGAQGIGVMAAVITALTRWPPFIGRQVRSAAVPTPGRARPQAQNYTPFGYCWHEGVLEPDPKEAPVRVRIFELFQEVGRASAVATAINAGGARRRDGGRFKVVDVERIIRDPIAKGVYRGNKRTPTPRMRTRDDEPGPLVAVRPLVSDALWEACNRKLGAAGAAHEAD